jgi:dTDP-4-amino-4,6-dideoxygalactose transaminase
VPARRNDSPSIEHLVARLTGEQVRGYRAFRRSEQRVETRPLGMSAITEALLGSVEYEEIAARRRRNFQVISRGLEALNVLHIGAPEQAVPFCYPFLPPRSIDRKRLHARNVFVPAFWPEITGRLGGAFEFERRLAREMLPLPVDHRMDEDDCRRVVELVREFLDNPGAVPRAGGA